MFNIDDFVQLKNPFWYKGQNLGGKKGFVISTKSYIMVEVYLDNAEAIIVKCFLNEIEKPIFKEDAEFYTKYCEDADYE